jgi:P-type Cu+ transporter
MNKTIQLRITGMTCASCVLHIETDLKKLKGVKEATVNLPLRAGSVTFDPHQMPEKDILSAVKKAGYKAVVEEEHAGHDMGDHAGHVQAEDRAHLRERLSQLIVSAVLSAVVLTLGFVWKVEYGMQIMMGLSLAILIYSGRGFFLRGIPDLLKGRPQMDTLVALGVGAAFIYSSYLTLFTMQEKEYFMDVAIITTFILLGRYLEARAKGKAGDAIRKLLELSAKVAHRIGKNGKIEDIQPDLIHKGDLLRVKPGEKIPTDGEIVEGSATIDESMVTGESIPVDKAEGAKIIGATINGNTSFVMRATGVGKDTLLSKIIQMVQTAQMSKAPIQKLVDKVAGYFVWGVIAIGTATFVGWTIVGSPTQALLPTVAVLIIACPCALGLATPISIVVGSGKGAQLGILIKKPESLEKAHKVTAICFDKTGTITKGHPEVKTFECLNGEKTDALRLALALETHSEHPLARSVTDFIKKNKDIGDPAEVAHFKNLAGLGVEGKIGAKSYAMGSHKLMEKIKVLDPKSEKQIKALQAKGQTVLALSDGKSVLALFGVQDGIKESSKAAIEQLHRRHIKTVMITGDHKTVAEAIAKEVGIDEVYSEVAPDQKASIVAKLEKEGYFVAMAGDGINDSPALAEADLGIAMGTGTDVAIETGDLVLVKGDLEKAVEAIELSRATLRNIKQNLFWAFIYNSIGIPLAALGFLTPAFSAGAMAFSSISVVLNALRLKRFKIKH